MLLHRGCLQDGRAGVSWLTGLHAADWVAHEPVSCDKDALEAEMLDVSSTLTLAAERLESMLWFGLLEQMDESVEMFNTQLNDTIPLEFATHSNKGNKTTIPAKNWPG